MRTARRTEAEIYTPISLQVKKLNKNGIYPLEVKTRLNMIIVNKADLEKASQLRISDEITIASKH